MINRELAKNLVKQRCDFSLQRHLYFVAEAMQAMAHFLDQDSKIEHWYIVGLLHDIDWNDNINTPEKHCDDQTAKYLTTNDVPQDWIMDMRSHCDWQKIERDSLIRKSLVSIDELSGFCVAVALMRPTKLIGMNSSSVLKKFKDKQFARNVNREDMLACQNFFNISMPDLLDKHLLPAFNNIASEWQLT